MGDLTEAIAEAICTPPMVCEACRRKADLAAAAAKAWLADQTEVLFVERVGEARLSTGRNAIDCADGPVVALWRSGAERVTDCPNVLHVLRADALEREAI